MDEVAPDRRLSLPMLTRVFDSLPEMILLIDDEMRIAHANGRLLDEMGYDLEEIVGTDATGYLHPDDVAYMLSSFDNRFDNPGTVGLLAPCRGRNADGSWRALEVIGVSLLDDPEVGLLMVTMRDLSSRVGLAGDPARLHSLVDRATDLLFLLEIQGRFTYANRRLVERHGHDNDRIVGSPWTTIIEPSQVPAAGRWFAEVAALGQGAQSTARFDLVDADGGIHPYEWRASAHLDDPVIAGVVLSGRDVTDIRDLEDKLREQNERLHHAATHDALTGLLNRNAFLDTVQAEISRRADTDHLIVLFADLDRFKAVNDRHGHEIGDAVLRVAAQRLRAAVREHDVVARYGGDEFTVLLGASTDAATADDIVARLAATMAEPIAVNQVHAAVGVTVGRASAPAGTADADQLLRDADASMYAAKGTNRPDR